MGGSELRRKRICMVVHGPFPPDPRLYREARAAVDAGYEVDVVAARDPGQAPEEELDGIRIVRVPVRHRHGAGLAAAVWEYGAFMLLASARVARLMRRRRYEIVQVHNPPDFLIVSALVPKLLGARVILDVHDLSTDMFGMRFGDRRGARVVDGVLRSIERGAAALSDVVLTVHEPYRRELASRGVPAEKVQVVMNSLDERLLPAPSAGGGGDAFRVVYHGTLTPHYGVELLVDAFAEALPRIGDARLEIYGNGDSLPALRARASEHGLDGAVRLSEEFLSQREVLERVRDASVGVVPNLPIPLNRYALSSKLFEYVALGIPVVSADLPTIREYFPNDAVRFFRAGDSSSLAEALLDVATDPAAAERRAHAARARYEEYRWPSSARAYRAVLAALAGGSEA